VAGGLSEGRARSARHARSQRNGGAVREREKQSATIKCWERRMGLEVVLSVVLHSESHSRKKCRDKPRLFRFLLSDTPFSL